MCVWLRWLLLRVRRQLGFGMASGFVFVFLECRTMLFCWWDAAHGMRHGVVCVLVQCGTVCFVLVTRGKRFVGWTTHSFFHSLFRSLTHALFHSLTLSLGHSFTHSLFHSLTLSLTQSCMYMCATYDLRSIYCDAFVWFSMRHWRLRSFCSRRSPYYSSNANLFHWCFQSQKCVHALKLNFANWSCVLDINKLSQASSGPPVSHHNQTCCMAPDGDGPFKIQTHRFSDGAALANCGKDG